MIAARDELHELLAARAFRWGDFVLASGRRSDYFFDGKQVTLEGRGLFLAASLMLARCRELEVTAVAGDDGVGPLLGAIVALSGSGSEPPLRAFMIRKAEKQHGIAAKIAGPAPAAGERVALVDDVVTTGGSVFRRSRSWRRRGSRSPRSWSWSIGKRARRARWPSGPCRCTPSSGGASSAPEADAALSRPAARTGVTSTGGSRPAPRG